MVVLAFPRVPDANACARTVFGWIVFPGRTVYAVFIRIADPAAKDRARMLLGLILPGSATEKDIAIPLAAPAT